MNGTAVFHSDDYLTDVIVKYQVSLCNNNLFQFHKYKAKLMYKGGPILKVKVFAKHVASRYHFHMSTLVRHVE